MRFCMVTTFYPPYHFGGDATYVRSLARALNRRGHTVEVIHCVDAYALREGYEEKPSPIDDGIVVHRLCSDWGMLSPLVTQQTGRPGLKHAQLQTLLHRDFDVIHFHNISLIGGPAVLKMGTAPVKLYTLHEYWLLCATHVFWKDKKQPCDKRDCVRCSIKSGIPPQWWRYTALRHESVAHVDALLAPSEYAANRHRQAGFTGPINILPLFSTLHPGIPPVRKLGDCSCKEAIAQLSSSTRRPQFLFAGRVTAAKGIEPLVAAFSRLPDYDLIVAGDGNLLPQLKETYAAYPNIYFLGKLPQHQLIPLYQNTTALIFPSLMMETFGLTTVEAFACGAPVVARDAGGNRELIEKTGGGMVYRSEDELRAALRELVNKPGLRQQLGELAYKGYRSYYTEDIHLHRYLSQIHDIREAKGLPSQRRPSRRASAGQTVGQSANSKSREVVGIESSAAVSEAVRL